MSRDAKNPTGVLGMPIYKVLAKKNNVKLSKIPRFTWCKKWGVFLGLFGHTPRLYPLPPPRGLPPTGFCNPRGIVSGGIWWVQTFQRITILNLFLLYIFLSFLGIIDPAKKNASVFATADEIDENLTCEVVPPQMWSPPGVWFYCTNIKPPPFI